MANPFQQAVSFATEKKAAGVSTSQLLPWFQEKQPLFSTWNTRNAIKDGFKASSWVYASVFKLMQAVSSVPWAVFKKEGKDWEEQPGHLIEQLLENPNPFMTREDLIQRLTAQMFLGGNAIWSKITRGKNFDGAILELWPVDVSHINVVPHRLQFIDRYEYDAGGEKILFKPKQLMHTMFVDPSNPYWGMSPLQAVSRTVDTDNEAVKWNNIALANRLVTDGVFIFEEHMTEEQWNEARAQLRDSYQGAQNARTPLVIGGKAKWTQMSLSPAEMDFLESRVFNREEICSVFGVPLPLIGVYKDATLANIESARRIFWEDTVIPFLEGIRSAINKSIVPHFGDPKTLWIDFDLSDIPAVRDDYHKKVETGNKMFLMGVPLNRIIQKLQLDIDEVPGTGDKSFLPVNMQSAELAMLGDGEGGDGTPAGSEQGATNMTQPNKPKAKIKVRKAPRG